MPIRIDNDLPARRQPWEEENVFVMDKERHVQDIRPLKIAILNLMPNKLDTELHFAEKFIKYTITVRYHILQTESYVPTHVSSHIWRNFIIISQRSRQTF